MSKCDSMMSTGLIDRKASFTSFQHCLPHSSQPSLGPWVVNDSFVLSPPSASISPCDLSPIWRYLSYQARLPTRALQGHDIWAVVDCLSSGNCTMFVDDDQCAPHLDYRARASGITFEKPLTIHVHVLNLLFRKTG